MGNVTVEVVHDGTTYKGHIATIKRTHLGYEDHGLLSAFLEFAFPGGGVSLGGFNLTPSKDGAGVVGGAFAAAFIKAVIDTAGVDAWEALKSSQVIVLMDNADMRAVGFAGLDNGRVLLMEKLAAEWFGRD